mmetsp:Transcript_28130/g.80848  ORF Transcript_28130/g.80848 Transcript_28130/m.80848 type:complete len:545 (-) Transcript_28130:162-1796(-)
MVLAVVPPVWGTLKKPLVQYATQLDAAVATRFPRTHEKLQVIAAAAAAESVQSNGEISVTALPISLGRLLLSRGLFEASEATMLSPMESLLSELKLPKSTAQRGSTGGKDDEDDGEAPQDEQQKQLVPRCLAQPFYRVFVVPLRSGAHTFWVTGMCVQDTYATLVNRLGVDRLKQLLKTLQGMEVRRELVDAARHPRAAGQKAISYLGCEKLLGEGIAKLLSSRLASAVLGDRGASWAAGLSEPDECASGAAPAPSAAHAPGGVVAEARVGVRVSHEGGDSQLQLSQLEQDAALAMGLRLVVKNSFIELVPESLPPLPGVRRTQSCDPAFLRAHPGAGASPTAGVVPRHALSPPRGGAQAPRVSAPPPLMEVAEPTKTTLMLRNLPLDYTREQLLAELDGLGLSGMYNFVYLPIDFTRRRGLGYALIAADSQEVAEVMLERLSGHMPAAVANASASSGAMQWLNASAPSDGAAHQDEETWQVGWSEPCRTLEEHIDRYRNSPVMHPNMPDEYKPVIFQNGRRVTFPAPTRPIRPPRIRHMKASG